ncbi:integral membrane sensor signal transduction histidine kinase [Gloeothece citriformis PCC 7424]|uniref:histidine kinase n=1 Tax=Gloeothece citriformis (strain PCC 7424) TaxID=65393 RepID=B7KFV5_GLOC7|nr:HAMP domain-containing sensor histidine kinase [Gloeothece citriformis]ACK69148.1 integral membrane sensor signal transduction histidine kinase [Gloeothece citriformis PCC 7424]
MMFHRSRRNLARWFTLSMGSILCIFAWILYLLEARDQLHTFDEELYNTSRLMASGVEDGLYEQQQRISLEDVPILGTEALPFESNIVYARWYTPEKELLQFFGKTPSLQLQDKLGFETIKSNSTLLLRQLTLPVFQQKQLIGYLQIAASLTPVEESLWSLRVFLILGVPIVLGVIALTGWILGAIAMQPIRQAYEQLQRFTADASHELRNPLAAIRNNAQFGLLEPIDPHQQQTSLENIDQIAQSMGILVSNLLFLARNEGKLDPKALSLVDLESWLQPIIEEYTHQAEAKGLSLTYQLPQTRVMLKINPDLMRQAIANLLSNACRYTPSGGTVSLNVDVQTGWVILEVRDSGIGIPEPELSRIFERFYRVDPVRSRQTGGFGLGLAIAQQIVQAHGGEITATSRLEQGSTFQIKLPLS